MYFSLSTLGYLFLVFAVSTDGCKILIISPKMAFSHMNYMGRIADTLVEDKHDVTILQPIVHDQYPGSGSEKAKVVQVQLSQKVAEFVVNMMNSDFLTNIWTMAAINPLGPIIGGSHLAQLSQVACSDFLEKDDVIEWVRKENFDLAIVEPFDFCGFGFLQASGIRNVIPALSTGLMEGTAWQLGVPLAMSYNPAAQGATNDDPTLYNRFLNMLFTFSSYYFQYVNLQVADALTEKKLGKENFQPIGDMIGNSSWMFTNSDPLLDFAKPTLHKIVDLGGIGLRPTKPLDKHWDSVMKQRSKTVLISFGSVAPSSRMPLEMRNSIADTIRSLPDVTFIWKYEKPEEIDDFAKDVPNLILTKWSPQNDLIADGRLSAFITHGGAASAFESASKGVPLIVVPLFGDQVRNAKIVVKNKFGIELNKAALNDRALLKKTIMTILTEKRYKDEAMHLKKLMSLRPFSPQEKLQRVINLACEVPHIHTSINAGKDLSTIYYYNMDIFIYIALAVVVLLYVKYRFVKFCLSCVFGKSNKNKKVKEQ